MQACLQTSLKKQKNTPDIVSLISKQIWVECFTTISESMFYDPTKACRTSRDAYLFMLEFCKCHVTPTDYHVMFVCHVTPTSIRCKSRDPYLVMFECHVTPTSIRCKSRDPYLVMFECHVTPTSICCKSRGTYLFGFAFWVLPSACFFNTFFRNSAEHTKPQLAHLWMYACVCVCVCMYIYIYAL